MNDRHRFVLALPWLASLALAACSPAGSAEPPLQGAKLGGPFTLTDQNGASLDSRSLDGKYRIVYFGYTYCPDVCPVDLQHIGAALRRIEQEEPARAQRIQPVFITTDPERDTPPVLKEFVAAFHPRLIGLTGTPEQIATVSKAFGVWAMKKQQAGVSGYLVDHSRVSLLFGPKGEPIAILPSDQGADAVVAELDKWVK